ncbi:nose resistant to fluoxetine protein 6-like isoform X2 [Diabrotica undecimpunctata]
MDLFKIKYFVLFVMCGAVNGKINSETVQNLNMASTNIKISTECKNSLAIYMSRLNESTKREEDIWALQMLDATSKIPVGILSLNFGDMGDFNECIEIASTKDNIFGKYCLAHIGVNVSAVNTNLSYFQSATFLQKLLSRISAGFVMDGLASCSLCYSLALCLPNNCSDDDGTQITNYMIDTFGVGVESIMCQTKEDVDPPLDRDAIICISILSILLVLIILSTTTDLYFLHTQKDSVPPIFVSFSLYTNGKKVFEMPQRRSNLSCLDGIRVLSMLWIVLLHTHNTYLSGPLFNSNDVLNHSNKLLSMLFVRADLACDAFLLIGGLLVTYLYFSKKDDKRLTPARISKHYLHRYIRLTPGLAGVVLVSATLLRYFGSGPRWPITVFSFEGFCKRYWWTTVLYVQNWVNIETMCVGHSWYLDVDMQLFLLSPLIFWLLTNYPKTGIFVIVTGIFFSIGLSFSRAYTMELQAMVSGATMDPKPEYMNKYYLRTETRASPWLMGTILGYMLTRKQLTLMNLPKKIILPAWLFSFSLMIVCIFGGHSTLRGPDYRRLENSFYIALIRPSFCLAISWIIWACATNHGGYVNTFLSLPFFQFMNKFTYSIYLVHVQAIYPIVYSQKTAIYFSDFNIAYWFWGLFMLSFGLSIVWLLVFEYPAFALERVIFS